MTEKILFTKDPFSTKTCFYAVVGTQVAWIYRCAEGWKCAVKNGVSTKWLDEPHKSRKIAERAVLQIVEECK